MGTRSTNFFSLENPEENPQEIPGGPTDPANSATTQV